MKTYTHYGLEFALDASPEEIQAKLMELRELERPNRIRVTDKDKRILRVGLGERAKARQRNVDKLRERYMK